MIPWFLGYPSSRPSRSPDMVERSEQSDDAVQAFHRWRVSSYTQVSGTGGPGFETTCRFIPQSKLKEHFDQDRQLENLLDAVLDSTKRHAVSTQYVRENYLKCFATLLCIGEGSMIYQFRQHRPLRDQNLPFRSEPANFPLTVSGKFEAFKKEQLLQRSLIRVLEDEVIRLAMNEATIAGNDVKRGLPVPSQLHMRITLGLILFFSL